MRKGRVVLAAGLMAALTVGCGEAGETQISTVSVDNNGGVSHHIAGIFDQSYYDLKELEELTQERVDAYCTEQGEDAVSVESLEEKDGSILIDMKYRGTQDYRAFNHRELWATTVEEAENAGYELDQVAFISTEREPYEPGDIDDFEQMSVLIIETLSDEQLLVNVPGKVQYVNQTVGSSVALTIDGKKSVKIQGNGEDAQAESVLSYIVYR